MSTPIFFIIESGGGDYKIINYLVQVLQKKILLPRK